MQKIWGIHMVWDDGKASPDAKDIAIGAEAAMPISVADDDWFGKTGKGVGRCIRAAKLSMSAKHREIVGVGAEQFDALGTLAAGDIGVGRKSDRDLLEDARLVPEVPELGDGHANVVRVGVAKVVIDAHKLFRVRVGKGAK